MSDSSVGSGWITGCILAFSASIIGSASNLCIRRSYILEKGDTLRNDKLYGDDAITSTELTDGNTSSDEDEDCCNEDFCSDDNSTNYESSTTIILGKTLTQKQNKFKSRPLCLRVFGVIGMTTLVPVMNTSALHFASPSILMCFGSGLSLVWTALLSEITIGERPSQQQMAGSGLIVLGGFVVAIFGDHTNMPKMSPGDVSTQYSNLFFVAYFVGLSLWIAFLGSLIRYGSPRLSRFSWGVIGGSLAGTSNFAKDAIALAGNGGLGSTTSSLYFYGLLLGAGILSISSFILSVECMKRYDATYSSASYAGADVISVSVMAAVHYHTFHNLKGMENLVLYPVGLLLTVFGCAILAFEQNADDKEVDKNPKHAESYRYSYGAINIDSDECDIQLRDV